MDTLVTITVVSHSQEAADKATDAAFSHIQHLENIFNSYADDSEISLINTHAGISAVRVSPQCIELLEKARYVSEKTGGAFDITIVPVMHLYDFHKKIRPDESMIRKNLPLIQYRDMIIDRQKSTVFLRKKGMRIDPGGIAKGYAADRAETILKEQGIQSGLIAVAGDIRAFGLKPGGSFWKIGIRNPAATDNEDNVIATVVLRDMAISTSGDYERFIEANGKRYHHLLDPKTGLSSGKCRSVSVIAQEGVLADAFATGVFILGPEKGLKVLEGVGLDGMIIDGQGKTHLTPGARERLEFKNNSR
jgi:thiamine biosynthesis lipoprotein